MVARGREPASTRDERILAGARACEGGWLRRATCEPADRGREPASTRDELTHGLLPSSCS